MLPGNIHQSGVWNKMAEIEIECEQLNVVCTGAYLRQKSKSSPLPMGSVCNWSVRAFFPFFSLCVCVCCMKGRGYRTDTETFITQIYYIVKSATIGV